MRTQTHHRLKTLMALLILVWAITSCDLINDDNNNFDTVQIGSQVWMAADLAIPVGNSFYPTYIYVDDDGNRDTVEHRGYGRLYDFESSQVACPTGWRLPTDEDWKQLEDYLGGPELAGGKLKSTRTKEPGRVGHPGWWLPNEGATNETGFAALPGGYAYRSRRCTYAGGYGGWWSYVDDPSHSVFGRVLYFSSRVLHRETLNKGEYHSVRCLRNN